MPGFGNLQRADVGLLVAEALVLGRILRAQLHRHARSHGDRDHLLVHAFGVHINLDGAAAARDSLEQRLPEIVTALGYAALAVHTHRQTLDLRTFLQQHRQRVAAVIRMRIGSESFDAVIGIGAVGPLVGVRPDSQLEVQSARRGLRGNEFESIQIHLPFVIAEHNRRRQHRAVRRGKLHHVHAVPWNLEEIRIRKVQIIVRDPLREVIFDPERKTEAVEAARRKHVEIPDPEIAVVEPRLVFHFTAEVASHATQFVGRLLQDRLRHMQRNARIGSERNALREFQQPINVAAHVTAGDDCCRHPGKPARR